MTDAIIILIFYSLLAYLSLSFMGKIFRGIKNWADDFNKSMMPKKNKLGKKSGRDEAAS